MDPQIINDAYDELIARREMLRVAETKKFMAEQVYEGALAHGVADKTIGGKNDLERDSSIAIVLKDEIYERDEAKLQQMSAKAAYDIAELDVKRVEALLKLEVK